MTQNNIGEFLNSGAILRLPNGRICFWQGPFQQQVLTKNLEFDVTLQDFYSREPQALKFKNPMQMLDVPKLRSLLMAYIGDEKLSTSRADFETTTLQAYERIFQTIQGRIQRGEIDKVVPVVTAKSKNVPSLVDRAIMLNHLLEAHENLYVYGFWQGDDGILGATPEILFTKEGSSIRSVALAGTCPRSDVGIRMPLLKDPKELKEHELVIKDIKSVIEKWGWVRVGATEILELPALLHLKTSIELESTTAQVDDLIKALHPTAALGVSPRNYGLSWLKNLDGQGHRRWFGAPLMFRVPPHNHENKEAWICLVAIRNLQWSKEGSWLDTGAGLVSNSELQREWRELDVKRESVFKMLGF